MTKEEVRQALETPSKKSRKALARLALEMETEEKERYTKILIKKDWEGEALSAYRAYRRAYVLSRIALVLAAVVIGASYMVGDFGMRLLTSWMNRYALAGGVLVGMCLFGGGTLLLNDRKERLIAYGILAGL